MFKVFTPYDKYEMALANAAIGWLTLQEEVLLQVIGKVKTIDLHLSTATADQILAMGIKAA